MSANPPAVVEESTIISGRALEILDEIETCRDKLETTLAPAQEFEYAHRGALLCAEASRFFYGRMYEFLARIETNGLWRVPKENGFQKYPTYNDYFAEVRRRISDLSDRSIAQRVVMSKTLRQIGVDYEAMGHLLEEKPSITADLLQDTVEPWTGRFQGFDDATRERVAKELGYASTKDCPDDPELMAQLLQERVAPPEVGHSEATQLKMRVKAQTNFWVGYIARDDVIVAQLVYRDAGGKRVFLERRYVSENGSIREPKWKRLLSALLTKIHPYRSQK